MINKNFYNYSNFPFSPFFLARVVDKLVSGNQVVPPSLHPSFFSGLIFQLTDRGSPRACH